MRNSTTHSPAHEEEDREIPTNSSNEEQHDKDDPTHVPKRFVLGLSDCPDDCFVVVAVLIAVFANYDDDDDEEASELKRQATLCLVGAKNGTRIFLHTKTDDEFIHVKELVNGTWNSISKKLMPHAPHGSIMRADAYQVNDAGNRVMAVIEETDKKTKQHPRDLCKFLKKLPMVASGNRSGETLNSSTLWTEYEVFINRCSDGVPRRIDSSFSVNGIESIAMSGDGAMSLWQAIPL